MKTDLPLCCSQCLEEIDLTKEHYTGERGSCLCPKCAGKDVGITTNSTLDPLPGPQNTPFLGITGVGTGLLPGEKNELHTRQLVRETHRNFLTIGKLLKENQDNAYWSLTGHGSFSEYIESLGISKSAGYSMIASFQSIGLLSEETILEIGIAKMGLLISANRIEDADTVALAKVSPVRDLKEHLGHRITMNDQTKTIICPHCGKKIIGAQWVRKEGE